MRGRAAAFLVAGAVAASVVGCASSSASSTPAPTGLARPSSAPTLQGTPGHFDNGTFSFAYPTSWRVLSGPFQEGIAVETYAVLGTGTWRTGCVTSNGGGSCTGDSADVSGGEVVVKIWNVVTGPANDCQFGGDQANETLGSNAIALSSQGDAITWEIRGPGARFAWIGNMEIQAWTGSPEALAQVEALVGSFRWADNPSPMSSCSPASN